MFLALERIIRRLTWGLVCIDVFCPLCVCFEGRNRKLQMFYRIEFTWAKELTQKGSRSALSDYLHACDAAGLGSIITQNDRNEAER